MCDSLSSGTAVVDRIAHIFEHELGRPVPATDTDLFESGALDSLAFVNLLLHMEREFGVVVNLGSLELERFRTLAGIAAFVEAQGAVDADAPAIGRVARG